MNLTPTEQTQSLTASSPHVSLSLFGRDPIEEVVDPKWVSFSTILETQGVQILPSRASSNNAIFVAVEHHPKTFSRVREPIPPERRVLVCVEPFVVNPIQFSDKVRARYGHVISISSGLGPGQVDTLWDGGHLGALDEVRQFAIESAHAARQPGSVSMLNANKFSAVPGSLYGKRFQVISDIADLDVPTYLGGHGWNNPYKSQLTQVAYTSALSIRTGIMPLLSELKQRNVRKLPKVRFIAQVASAAEFFRGFEFGIAIENQSGYFTEKALNVMLGGAIPLYLGCDPTKFGIPKDAIIDVGAEFDGDFRLAYTEVVHDLERKQRLLDVGRDWILSGDANERWGTMEGQIKLASHIVEYWRRFND